ncbi:MAG: histidine kinase N-terminal 7TM domain-containing protein [Spirochaetia bacterium]|nr:histidine kinase N-terminal 7TM domain-containing protein [Spirochaetia bacterium]
MSVFLASILGCTTVIHVFLASLGFSRTRANPGTRAFAWLCLCCAVYAGGYIGEILSPDLETLLRFTRIQYLGLAFIPACIFIMVIEFDGRWNKSRARALFFLPSVITFLLVLFIDRHALFYVSPSMVRVEGLSILRTAKGPWYFVQLAYLYLSFVFGLWLFVSAWSKGSHAKRVQARYLVAGGLMPLIGNFLYLYVGTPYGLDIAPVTLAGTAILFAFGFLRHGAFDLAPLARDAVFDQMRDAIVVVDEKDRLVDFNRSARTIIPGLYDKVAILGVPAGAVLADYPELAAAFSDDLAKDFFLTLPDGSARQFQARLSRLEDLHKRHRGRVLTLVDMTERAALEARLKELAQVDELTGLLNRRHFMELARTELERARRYNRPFGVALMDLNGFKHINDTWGHAAGDEALRLVSRLCKDSLRACDFVGRYGGDEFAFAFPECDEGLAEAAAEKLARVVSAATLTLGGQLVFLSASIGTAGGTGAACPDLEDMLAAADAMMYRKKKAGRKDG